MCVRSQSTGSRECPAVKAGKQSHRSVRADAYSASWEVGLALDCWARIVLSTGSGLPVLGQEWKCARELKTQGCKGRFTSCVLNSHQSFHVRWKTNISGGEQTCPS